MKKILADFQICISVPLSMKSVEKYAKPSSVVPQFLSVIMQFAC